MNALNRTPKTYREHDQSNAPRAGGNGSRSILGMRVDETDCDAVAEKVRSWSDGGSRYVCVSNVHMVMESYDRPDFRSIVNNADLVAADGVPVIWVSHWLGLRRQQRVFGPAITLKLCEVAAREGIPVGLLGGSPDVLRDLVSALRSQFSTLRLAYSYSPPFRTLSPEEDEKIVDDITRSGARIVFVGLGCPKQERWMSEHRGRVPATMLGVGWAFDIISGHSKVAPRWIQKAGMEWLYRLVCNPKKLWKRHLKHYPRFVLFVAMELMKIKRVQLQTPYDR